MRLNAMKVVFVLALIAAVAVGMAAAQGGPPPGGGAGRGGAPGAGGPPGGGAPGGGQGRGGGRGPAGPSFTVTSAAWPDGDVIPAKFSNAGGSTSPAFDFKWVQAGAEVVAPATLAAYAVVFHDIENSSARGTVDTLHWMIWDVPGTAKGLAEGLPMGDLPDGTKQSATAIGRGKYFGPGAGPGPYHHYVFEFYALDAKVDLPNTATRAEVMAKMEGHVIGKSAFTGRYNQ
jgi:Raf kinase inhibitor-like YbhB/YbcL family protein